MRKARRYILFLIVISLVLVGLSGCNKVTRVTLEEVLEKVNAATIEIESFHMTITATYPGNFVQSMESDFMLPDRARLVGFEQGIKMYEVRRIGDNIYRWDSESGLWELMEGYIAEGTLLSLQAWARQFVAEEIAKSLEKLDYIEALPDEVINGVICEHYRGSYDYYNLDYYREQIENEIDPDRKESLQSILATMEQMQEEMETSAVSEYWFGKDDHILRQSRSTTSITMTEDTDFKGTIVPAEERVTIIGTATFSNFNEPVEIEEPTLE